MFTLFDIFGKYHQMYFPDEHINTYAISKVSKESVSQIQFNKPKAK